MARLLLLTIAVVATAATAAAWFDAGTVQDELIVKYNIVPDPFHTSNFINMPRNAYDARFEEKIPFRYMGERPQDRTTVLCRGTDYRVCLLFDRWDSVAGIRLSVKQSDMERSGFDLSDVPEWELNWNRAAGENVYSATVFFLSKEDLLEGRRLRPGGLTAPDGIWILQTDKNGTEINRLHVPNEQSQATSAGFTEQACFFGMGKHYFQELSKDGTCENHRPYFMLYGPESKTLNGFGFVQYGKVTTDSSTGRQSWFESPPAKVAKMIAPNSPDCLEDWVNEKGLFTMHVYFVSSPYFTRC